MSPLLIKVILPFVLPMVSAGIRAALAPHVGKIPGWALTLINVILGTTTTVLTGDPTQLAGEVAAGATAGLAGSGVYDVTRKVAESRA